MRTRHIQRTIRRAQLLGPDGAPIPAKKEIPFIQWLPDGKSTGCSIDRGPEVYAQAARFIAKGGRYALVAGGGKAELVAGFPMEGGEKGEMTVVAEELLQSAEGPQVLFAIDRLVIASVANMDKFTVTQEQA